MSSDCAGFTIVDYKSRTVTLSSEKWDNHIISRHPEMADYVSSVEETVLNPDVVYESKSDTETEVFFRLATETKHPKLYITVPVGYNNNKGNVKTAFFQPDFGGINEKGIKYVKS